MLTDIQRFIHWVRRRNPAARTWRDYSYDLAQFVAVVGDVAPETITLHTLDHFITLQARQGYTPATINRRLAAVASLYAFLSDEHPDLVSPVVPRRHTLRTPRRLPRPAQSQAVSAFFEVIEAPRDRAMFLLMLRCGLRISEVARLEMKDLFLAEAFPRLVVQGKGAKERSVYLSLQAEGALQAWLELRPSVTGERVFLSYRGQGLSTTAIHLRLMHYREASGTAFSAHHLRHTFANDLLAADVPVTSIQKLLGHAWLETTQLYVAANDRQVQADLAAAAAHLEGWR